MSLSEDDILNLWREADTNYMNMQSMLYDAYSLAFPSRNQYLEYQDINKNITETDRTFKQYDVTISHNAGILANAIISNMTPPGEEWATLLPGKHVQSNPVIDEKLQDTSEQIFGALNQSNFYSVFPLTMEDFVVGTAVLMIRPGTQENPLIFEHVPIGYARFNEGRLGKIDSVWIKYVDFYIRDFENRFGIPLTESMRTQLNGNIDSIVTIKIGYVYDSEDKAHDYVVIDNDDNILSQQRVNSFPFIIGRYSPHDQSVYGYGIILKHLSFFQKFTKLTNDLYLGARLAVRPPIQVDQELMKSSTITIEPGGLYASKNTTKEIIKPITVSITFEAAESLYQQLVQQISNLFFVNPLGALPKAPAMTATEVTFRINEFSQATSGLAPRWKVDFLLQIIQKSADILSDLQLMVPIKINNTEIQIKYVSPLSNLEGIQKWDNVKQLAEDLKPFFGPLTPLVFKLEKLPMYGAKRRGVDEELVLSPAEVLKVQDQLQKQVAQIMAQSSGQSNAQPQPSPQLQGGAQNEP